MNTTIYYSYFIGLCDGLTVVVLFLHAGVCSRNVISIMTQTLCFCRQPRVHDSQWATRQPPISPLHPKGLCEGQVAVLSCPTHLWPDTVSCVPREEKTIQDINIASFRCSSAQGNGSSKCLAWIYQLFRVFWWSEHNILGSTHHLCFMKTTTGWKLALFSASGKEEILTIMHLHHCLRDQHSRNWFL
jgi:hypothetical protein